MSVRPNVYTKDYAWEILKPSFPAESIKIIRQALEGIPGGAYENLEIRYFDRKGYPEWHDSIKSQNHSIGKLM